MRGRIAALVAIGGMAIAPTGAGARIVSGKATNGYCRVVAGEKLLAASGGASALCTEVERAIAAAAPKARYRVEVKVLPRSRLSAALVVNGRTLPEQKFAVMDRELGQGSIQRFARGLADEVAQAARR